MTEAATRLDELKAQAEAFHKAHPEVWELFVKFTFDRIERGFDHYGAKAIWERVRWETAGGAGEPELKLNNNYVTLYARRFARMYPDHADFFRERIQKSAMVPPRNRPEPTRHDLDGAAE